jgi:hypothetical protein
MCRSFLLINGVITAMRLAHKHKDCVSENEHDKSHRRCRKDRNGNHQLVFSHGQVQISLARRPKVHTIIKPNLYRINTFWVCQSRKHEREDAKKATGLNA